MSKRRSPGDGSVYQRASDGMHCAALSWLDNQGIRRRKTLYAKTKPAVREKLRNAQAELRAGRLPLPGDKQTFGQFLEHWFEQVVKPRIRPTTYASRIAWVYKHILPAIGSVPLQKLTAEHIERFQAAKLKEGKAPGTVKQYRRTIISCLEVAVQRGYITRNVGRLAGSFRSPQPDIRCLDQEQARALLEAVKGDRFYALFLIALTLGLRKGELLALRWQDVNLDKATLQVSGSIQRIGGKSERVEVKTTHSNRTLRLTPQIVDALRARRDIQQFERHMSGRWVDTGYIFTSRDGPVFCREHILLYFQRILTRTGLPRVTFHSLRHTALTIMLGAGVQIHLVSRIAGHANVTTTLNRYAHVLARAEAQTVDILATMYA